MRKDLQSFVETHEKPFLVIDSESRIVAANAAFISAYQTSLEEVLGQNCCQVTHGSERPCYEAGEECPLQRVLETGRPHSCLHVHAHEDKGHHVHQVRVKGFPLRLADGSSYLGEVMEEIAVHPADHDADCMIGRSPAFLAALESMQKWAKSDAPVLIQGETGTGKELAAKFIQEDRVRSLIVASSFLATTTGSSVSQCKTCPHFLKRTLHGVQLRILGCRSTRSP